MYNILYIRKKNRKFSPLLVKVLNYEYVLCICMGYASLEMYRNELIDKTFALSYTGL